MDSEFLDMMPHQVGIEPAVDRDAWGNITFGTQVPYQARIENKRRMVINSRGEEVLSDTTLYLDTVDRITEDDRVTLPSGYLPSHPEIKSVYRMDDEYGPYCTKLYV